MLALNASPHACCCFLQAANKGSVMAERLLDMIWQLTMPADAPPELLAADAMANVLREYGGRGHREYCDAYLKRCVEQLRARQGVFTALRTLRSLLDLYGVNDKATPMCEVRPGVVRGGM